MPADMTAARERAKSAGNIARAKMAQARRDAEDRAALRNLPPAQYASMPEPTGDAEIDSAADLNAVQAGIRARARDEEARKALATDSEYWACLCFQTRAQKEAFLLALGLLELGDKYIDGIRAAKLLGIAIPAEQPPYHDTTKTDPTWSAFVD